ncbi:MAG TPA: GNAT family N-acetyltransferase [Longimicrobiaceae bacterium]|nr:GNAT family N-acetyltransferase [Longimicrobiaceae bacterium]
MQIVRLTEPDHRWRDDATRILIDALAHVPSAWKSSVEAEGEVESFVRDPDRLALVAMEDQEVRGWIGAIRHSSFAWELHPLVVDPKHQRQGWGTRLVEALEEAAAAEGVLTIWLGTDDDFGGTNLFGEDLYPDVLARLLELKATRGHPYVFYERLGYVVTGVFPDVDGPGRHDILMAKRISNRGHGDRRNSGGGSGASRRSAASPDRSDRNREPKG